MAKSTINLGTTPNDRTGDTLRDAGSKTNSNFNELYTALGNGTTLGIAVTGATNGQVLKFNGTSFVPATDENTDVVTSVNTKTGTVVLNADDVLEAAGTPTNLYFTNARARAAISASGALAYNSTTGALTFTQGNTDTVAEGSTNQYFTTARARSSISASGALAYNSTTGALTFTQGNTDTVAEGTINQYYTSGRFDFTLSQKTTDNLTEGTTNKYFSNTLARGAISATGALSYNSTTGVISYTAPTIPTDISNLTDTTNLIPADVSDLTDTTNLIPADVSDLTDTTNLIPADVSDLSDTTNLLQTASASAPATATSTGAAGDIAYDSGFIYVCVATNTWVRAALSTW